MGTRLEDWEAVEALSAKEPHKVIPCFGVHPWFAHHHALDLAAASDPSQLLDSPPNGKDHPSRHPDLLARMAPIPPERWMPRLRSLLTDHPHAVVGEFGLDRAAVVPGTRLQPAWSHQLALTEMHLRLASELGRPASLHCVQGYGALQDMLRTLGPEGCPPRIMLHRCGAICGVLGNNEPSHRNPGAAVHLLITPKLSSMCSLADGSGEMLARRYLYMAWGAKDLASAPVPCSRGRHTGQPGKRVQGIG
ncbi:hypothetical protein Vafri_2330 [Volvox africanus]|nr:hypothetical protein Vafri_2330 [Volvox africanus]